MTAVGSYNWGTYQLNGDMEKFCYTKDLLTDSQIAAIRASASSSVGFSYDMLGRLTEKTVNTGSAAKTTSYTYLDGASGSTTTRVGTVTADGNTTSYAYDQDGNITSKTGYGGDFQYHYNELNELIREDNSVLDQTIVYQYNSGGNIVSKSNYGYTTGDISGQPELTIAYTYDTVWKDKLTDYNSKPIVYDQIGNPTSYDDWTFTWGSGRQLKEMKKGALGEPDITFKYNDDGIRTEKKVGEVTTKYYLDGDKVILEDNGTDKIHYTYDAGGSLVGMNLTTGSTSNEYYYIRNTQGDITGIMDSNGTQVVSYSYDCWGKLAPSKSELDDNTDTNKDGITGTLRDTVGIKNPYRYRGYRYDIETQLYYLNSRYYNPEWGRFINADAIVGQTGELLSHNMFVYCSNNTVMMKDPSGYRAISASDQSEETDEIRHVSLQSAKQGQISLNRFMNKLNKFEKAEKASKLVYAATFVTGVATTVASKTSQYWECLGSVKLTSGIATVSLIFSTNTIWKNPYTTIKQKSLLTMNNILFTAIGVAAGAFIGSISAPIWVVAGLAIGTSLGVSYLQGQVDKAILKKS